MKYVKTSLMVVILSVLVCGTSSVEAGEIIGETTCHELFTGKEDLWPTWHSLPIAVELYPSDKSGKIQRDLTRIKIIYSKNQWGTENYKGTDVSSSERLKLINLLKEGLECCKTAKESLMKVEKTLGSVVDTDNDSLAVAFKSTKKAEKINVILKIKDSDYYLNESEASKLVQYLMKPEKGKQELLQKITEKEFEDYRKGRKKIVGETTCYYDIIDMGGTLQVHRTILQIMFLPNPAGYPEDPPDLHTLYIDLFEYEQIGPRQIKSPKASGYFNSSEIPKLIGFLKLALKNCKIIKENKLKVNRHLGKVEEKYKYANYLSVGLKSTEEAVKVNVILSVEDTDFYLDEQEVSELIPLLEKAHEIALMEEKRLKEERRKEEEERKKADKLLVIPGE